MHVSRRVLFTIVTLLMAAPLHAQDPQTAVVWRDRGDPALLNLLIGPGAPDREPGTRFRFVSESKSGTSPKFDVQDEHGVTWKAKLGEEGRTETAAARLVWAVGFVVDEDYYRPEIQVSGMRTLKRGQQFVTADGRVTGVRLEREAAETTSKGWSWYENPLVGTRQFNALRVMMALINNWDLKAVNNGESGAAGEPMVYRVSDLGATFGRTGNSLRRSKGLPREFAETAFIDKVSPTTVDFVMHSRPFLLSVFNVPNYRTRTRMESIVKHIPIDDARWIGDRLAALSVTQIADCFRAGGFPPADVEAYTAVIVKRIAALTALRPTSPDHVEVRTATAPR
jgi:hypothetical protein